MEGEEENIPLGERNRPTDEAEDNEVEGETSFTDRERLRERDDDNRVGTEESGGRVNPAFEMPEPLDPVSALDYESEIMRINDNEREEMADTREKALILEKLKLKENLLEKVYKKRFRGTHGTNTKRLLTSLEIVRGKNGNVTGLSFNDPEKTSDAKGKSVIVGAGGGNPMKSKNLPAKFKQLVNKAIEEFEETADSVTYNTIRTSDPELPINQDVLDEVRDDTIGRIESNIDDTTQTIREDKDEMRRRGPYLTFNEDRDSRSIITGVIFEQNNKPKEMIRNLKPDIKFWKELADKEKPEEMEKGSEERRRSESRKRFFMGLHKTAKLQTEYIRLKHNIKPGEEETLGTMEDAVEKSNMRTFEKFKEWAKKNMLGLSAVAISVAGIITTIAMGAKKAVKVGGNALKKFGKALGNFLGKLGPFFSGLATLAAAIIKFMADGFFWLADHLWILAVAITFALYEWWKNRKKK